MDVIQELESELNNNNEVKCDDGDWCTVGRKKKTQKKPKKRLQEQVSILPPIYEKISDDEVYFTSSAECSDDDNNSLDSVIGQPKTVTTRIISINNNNNVGSDPSQRPSIEELNIRNLKLKSADGQTHAACCFAKKLDKLTDKEMFIRRSSPKLKLTSTVNSGDSPDVSCSQCSQYHNTLPGFVNYFKTRNTIERPLPELTKADQQLIDSANKFRTGVSVQNQSWKIASPSPSHENVLPCGPPPILSLDNDLPSFRPQNAQIKTESKAINQNSEVALNRTSKLKAETEACSSKPEADQSAALNEKCCKMEKSLQETKLKLQNLYDNLESLKLDSTIYFCKLIDLLDS